MQNRKLLVVAVLSTVLSISSLSAIANSLILKADKAYTTGNLINLGYIYSKNTHNTVVSYLYSKAMLTKNIAQYAEKFVDNNPDSFMRSDLIHQLLIFYINNNSYPSYIRIFKLLNNTQTSLNEKCGYDYSLLMTKSTNKLTMNNDWIIDNNIPQWCATLIGAQYAPETKERDLTFYNLIINNKTDILNQITRDLTGNQINFYKYQDSKISDLNKNSNYYKYLVVFRISLIGHKDPYSAYAEFKTAIIDSNTKIFLGNYLAMQFALKHEFEKSIELYDQYPTTQMSDDEFEWRSRSYMYFGKWNKVIDSISDMPEMLKSKNTWLYWRGKAYAQLGDQDMATKFLRQIPVDYSYYSMLMQSELDDGVEFMTNPPKANSFSNPIVNDAFELYKLGKSNNSKHLIEIATSQWDYASKKSTDQDLLAMSTIANKQSAYNLSIFAADQMHERYMGLSYPTPFLNSYIKYSTLNNIDKSYTLAISRQESRFNASVVAFDGGVGLMQIMPQTGLYIAKKIPSKNCYAKGFDCNIKFGSWYLGNLYSKFDKNIIYSTAAYNAGPSRAKRWKDKLGKLDNLVQIELIPIQITRNYVQKVLINKAIYDSKFNNKNTINLLSYVSKLNKNRYLNKSDDGNTDAQKIGNQ